MPLSLVRAPHWKKSPKAAPRLGAQTPSRDAHGSGCGPVSIMQKLEPESARFHKVSVQEPEPSVMVWAVSVRIGCSLNSFFFFVCFEKLQNCC